MLFKIKIEHDALPKSRCPAKSKNGSLISVDTETGEIKINSKKFCETKFLTFSSAFGNTTCPCHNILRKFLLNDDLQLVVVGQGVDAHHETLFKQLRNLLGSYGYRKSFRYSSKIRELVPRYKKMFEESMTGSSISYMVWNILKGLNFSVIEYANNTLCVRNDNSQTQAMLLISVTSDDKFPYRIACDRLNRNAVVRSNSMLIPSVSEAGSFEEWAVFVMRASLALSINELCRHHEDRRSARNYRTYQARLSDNSTVCKTSIEMKPGSPASSISFDIDGLSEIEALFVTRKINQLVSKLCKSKK